MQKSLRFMAIAAILFLPQIAISTPDDAVWINAARTLRVSFLDPTLPAMPFEQWLNSIVKDRKGIEWEVNDCGENPGDGVVREYPVCVEARVLLEDRKTIGISLIMGTTAKGISGRPGIWMVYALEHGKYRGLPNKLQAVREYLSN